VRVAIYKPAIFLSQRLNNRFFRDFPHPLPEVRPGVVLECGAGDGKTDSAGWWFEHNLGWTSYNIEHDPQSFIFCEMSRPHATNLQTTLSNVKDAETTTYCDFIEEHEVELIDLFVLAVGGRELEVVEGMAGADVWPRIICAEIKKTPAAELTDALVGYSARGRDLHNLYFEREEQGNV
jgi:hypothetical protein